MIRFLTGNIKFMDLNWLYHICVLMMHELLFIISKNNCLIMTNNGKWIICFVRQTAFLTNAKWKCPKHLRKQKKTALIQWYNKIQFLHNVDSNSINWQNWKWLKPEFQNLLHMPMRINNITIFYVTKRMWQKS